MTSVSIIIRGRVQGVNFRYYTRQEAVRLGVRGTVMNLDNGSVLVRAEGEKEKLEALVAWCRTGPSRARVDELVIKEMPVEGFADFVILR